MSTSCPSCGVDNSVEEDSNHGEKQFVCTACGVVVDNKFLASDDLNMSKLVTPESRTLLNVNKLSTGLRNCLGGKNVCNGKKAGLNVIKMLSSIYHLPEYMANEVNSLYEKAFLSNKVINRPIKFKENLAAACVYSLMRQNEWPISINNVCSVVNCTKEVISLAMHFLDKHLGKKFHSPSIEELTETFLDKLKITEEAEKEKIRTKTITLLELSKDCWLITSRSPRACIFAAAFIVWKAAHPLRNKITVKVFCLKYQIQYQVAMTTFIQEINRTLLKLSSGLPWLKNETVNNRNVINYLDDILKYSTCLKLEAIEKYRKNASDTDLEGLTTQEIGFHAFRKVPKRKLPSEPLNPNISLTIDEKEIDSYICSASEIKFKKKYVDI